MPNTNQNRLEQNINNPFWITIKHLASKHQNIMHQSRIIKLKKTFNVSTFKSFFSSKERQLCMFALPTEDAIE